VTPLVAPISDELLDVGALNVRVPVLPLSRLAIIIGKNPKSADGEREKPYLSANELVWSIEREKNFARAMSAGTAADHSRMDFTD
jgi:hypothetical protein